MIHLTVIMFEVLQLALTEDVCFVGKRVFLGCIPIALIKALITSDFSDLFIFIAHHCISLCEDLNT